MRYLTLLLLLALLSPLSAQAGPGFVPADETVGPLGLNMPSAEVLKALGRPASQGPWIEEAATGLQVQEWKYPSRGLTITFGRNGAKGVAQVERFRVRAPSRDATSRGIRIGDRADRVRKAYAGLFGSESSAEALVVGSIYDGVIFTLKGGKVTEIFVGAAAE